MGLNLLKADYSDYGVRLTKEGLYVTASFDFLSSAGINIYDMDSKEIIEHIIFPTEFFVGNVASVLIKGLLSDKFGYLLFEDDKEFKDPFSRGFSLDYKYCIPYKKSSYKFSYDNPFIAPSDTVFYEASVKGQTMLDNKIKSNKGTFKAFKDKIKYFKDLGVTSLVLFPIYDTKEFQEKDFRSIVSLDTKTNYWGFGEGFHYSIKSELCTKANKEDELMEMIDSFHKNNLEIIPMMQFQDDKSIEYILDVLKYWLLKYKVDGFRLVGNNIPKDIILFNPLFKNTKLLIDNYDFAGYKPNGFFKNKNVYFINDYFMNQARRFVKGDEDTVSYLSFSVRENQKYVNPVRFVTDFAGFTLYDLVSYNVKHNEENGEDNTDGTDYNYSWNCGIEGPTSKKRVINLRKKQLRNLFLMMVLSQGTPMIRGGDEILNTQFGNNNPYCQDNEIGWVSYSNSLMSSSFTKFVKNAISFRRRHIILHQPKELMMFDYMSCKVPDVSFHGEEAFKVDLSPVSRGFGVLYFGDYSKQYTGEKEESIYIIYNMYWENREFALPLNDDNKQWKLLYSTDGSTDETFDEKNAKIISEKVYTAKARSISILML